ncbi:MAG TPA: hypothetical protein VF715_15115 [Thermoleophilaceae bacterium]
MTESEQLRQARAAALELLERDAELSELREAAWGLGTGLVETADDEDLWARLGEAGEQVLTLTDDQRLKLRGALSIDWAALLDEVGYQPPPPPEAYATELVEAIQTALESLEPADVQGARDKLRALGHTLADLSGHEDVSPSRLRRWLRRGVRVAGKVLVVVGVAAAGVALAHALPALAPLSPFLVEVGIEVLKDGATRVLEWTLDRVLPADGDEPGADEASDREAVDLIHGIRGGELGKLLNSWDLAAAGEIPTLPPIDETRQFVEHAMRALYGAWDAAIGAPWYGGDLAAHLDMLSTDLLRLRHELTEHEPRAPTVAETLRRVRDVLAGVKALLGRAIEPHR